MTIAEVRAASSLPLAKAWSSGGETTVTLSDPIKFQFDLAGTGLSFPNSRFYSLWTKDPDPRLNYVQIQVSKNLTWAQVQGELLETQEKLKQDQWSPDVVNGMNAEERLKFALSAGAPARSVGFGWKKGEFALVFTARRFPQATSWEDPNQGANYELELEIRKNH